MTTPTGGAGLPGQNARRSYPWLALVIGAPCAPIGLLGVVLGRTPSDARARGIVAIDTRSPASGWRRSS
ncbi:hypothetical protein [Cellulomonas chengniuliangii]|uniref:Uncharacterized protein n=1 Tax=Cellulomonas chengniuliangii TaxID=2968084 RepID=A0ABY5L1G0_9CELL|nr:hypothetical protein [Cellulomonas chengniuliangii]MCC2308229.1 hypothetical protein [Cellulomonas chengniuliangii]MCC2317236.1 hypothetical protein [Cellulomonas chengniuliangii]UUI76617.1 hypothetical protein NP064_06955 [Cellulomonas chengniuliangii]